MPARPSPRQSANQQPYNRPVAIRENKLDKDSEIPLFEQLEELMRARLDTNDLSPGDKLPSESELSDQFDISRMTVRHALDRLVREGLIVRKPGKGAFVARAKLEINPTTIFSFSAAMNTAGHVVRTHVIEKRVIPAPADIAKDLGLRAGKPVVYVFRLRYVDDQAAACARSYLPAQYYEGLLSQDLGRRPLAELMEEVSGLTISRTEDYFESALVRHDESSVLKVADGSAVLLVRGVAYTQSGLPVRSTKSIYRGDLFRFQLNPESGFAVRFNRA